MKSFNNIQKEIVTEELGTLIIKFDYETGSEDSYPNDQPLTTETIAIGKIHEIELVLFEKVGIDITNQVIRSKKALRLIEDKLIELIAEED